MGSSRRPRDPTRVAVPFYFAAMGLEHLWLRRRAKRQGAGAGDYEVRDTLASLTMGVASLVAPLVLPRILRPFTPGRGRFGKALLLTAAGALVATSAADAVVRRADAGRDASGDDGDVGLAANGHHLPLDGKPAATGRRRPSEPTVNAARRVATIGGPVAVVAGGIALTTTWMTRTTPEKLARLGRRATSGGRLGVLVALAAIVGWDFIYYWNHRFMHESRYMWANHVVHHSSEHYNLSTALRQPVAEALGTPIPYGALCLFGVDPDALVLARGVNLLYQFWIHTETVGRLGAYETAFNTPSHHRVHHGSNPRYLDRNHGSILIVWDRLFGTFEPEGEPVVYGLTKNIDTFNPARIATHEYRDILRDVAASTGWRERISYVVRGPGWATQNRATQLPSVTSVPAR